ncbi:MAG: DUF3887 domain-containing protein [Tissierellales bacterium]
MNKSRKVFLLLVTTGLFFLLIGCNRQNVEKVNVDEVKGWANTAAEKIFNGIDEENYSLFSEDFDQEMISGLTEDKFNQIVTQLGKFESGEIIDADKVEGYTRAYYKTRFSKISRDVTFTIVFSGTEDIKISGLFFK